MRFHGACNRPFVMVAEWLYDSFWSEWRAIDKRYPPFESDVIDRMRRVARDELRTWVQSNAIASGGPYLVPVNYDEVPGGG